MHTETFKAVAETVLADLHEEHEALDSMSPEDWAELFTERFLDAAEDLPE